MNLKKYLPQHGQDRITFEFEFSTFISESSFSGNEIGFICEATTK